MQPVATVPVSAAPPMSEQRVQPKAWKGESLRSLARRLKIALPLAKGRIVVLKSQRRLDLYSGDVLLKSYRVSLGSNPVGRKKQQGDGRTPEGQFYICTRNNKTSLFHIFLGLSYPALPDAKRAVENKAISPREFQAIRQRLASRGAPLWGTRLGGWVGIHGGTDGAFAHRTMKSRKSRDWTAGCVAITNREIDELYVATQIGTPVLIKP
jgi:murein L,D-transpeptidase YafK